MYKKESLPRPKYLCFILFKFLFPLICRIINNFVIHNGFWYKNLSISRILETVKSNVKIAYDMNNISFIYLILDGEYIKFDLADHYTQYNNLNMTECEIVKSTIREQKKKFEQVQTQSRVNLLKNIKAIIKEADKTPKLKQNGVEVIDVSSGGGVSHQKIDVKKNYQVPFANEIKNQVEIITGAVGLIFEPKQAEEILQNNEADLIFLGRELLRDPYLALRAAKELEEDIKWLPQYERAKNNHYA